MVSMKYERSGSLMGIDGKNYAEKMRQMDAVLTQILENEYGKFLGYYPPVFVISKCLEFWRPYFLASEDETDFKKRLDSANFFDNDGYVKENGQPQDNDNQLATYLKKQQPEDSPSTRKKITTFLEKQNPLSPKVQKKPMNWFFGNTKKDKEGSKKEKSSDKKQEKASPTQTAELDPNDYYPCEGSDIDEDDDSDVEGEYTFYNDSEDNDSMSIGGSSIRSDKEVTDLYEKELKMKLVENFVNKDTKEEEKKKTYKRSNSLKRLFSKKK